MKPSDIFLAGVPLVDTFGRTESEHAAAFMIWAMALRGDQWRAMRPRDLGGLMNSIPVRERPSWFTNPFLMPDFHALCDSGHARMGPGDTNRPIEFTPRGLRVLRRSPLNRKRTASPTSAEAAELFREVRGYVERRSAQRSMWDAPERRERFFGRAMTLITRWRAAK